MRGVCSTCRRPRPVNTRCTTCRNAFERQRYRRNRKANIARALRWQKANPEKRREICRNYARRMRQQLAAELARLPCFECGVHHTLERRADVIRRMLPATAREIREARPCFWGDPAGPKDPAGEQRLYRDTKKLGAVSVGQTFYPPAEARAAA